MICYDVMPNRRYLPSAMSWSPPGATLLAILLLGQLPQSALAADSCTDQWWWNSGLPFFSSCSDYAANHKLDTAISDTVGEIPVSFVSAMGAGMATGDGDTIQTLISTLLPLTTAVVAVQNPCGRWSTSTTTATEACCACGGGTTADETVRGTPQDNVTLAALRDVYRSTNGRSWLQQLGWNETDNFCSWGNVRAPTYLLTDRMLDDSCACELHSSIPSTAASVHTALLTRPPIHSHAASVL